MKSFILKKNLNNQKGIAMLMALMTMTILGILVAELVYETSIYNRIVFNQVDQLRARTFAKSGLKLALLQIHGANKAAIKAKEFNLSSELTNKIWQTPIILPAPAPKEFGEAESKALTTFNNSLDLNGRVAINITGESNKLSINQLVWINNLVNNPSTQGTPSQGQKNPEEKLKKVRAFFSQYLTPILTKKLEDDRSTQKNADYKTSFDNLLAWMDPNIQMDGDGRPKQEFYSRLTPKALTAKEGPIFSFSELHMVKGFDDELVELYSKHFSPLMTKGLNINQISEEVLAAILPEAAPRTIEDLIKRRSDPILGGPYKSADDFWKYAASLEPRAAEWKTNLSDTIAFTTEDEDGYRVVIQASSGNTNKTWLAYIGNPPPQPPQPSTTQPTKQAAYEGGDVVKDPGKPTESNAKNDNKVPSIIYLKAD